MIPKMELTPEICGRASRQGRNDLPSQQREILAVSLVQTGIVFLVSYLLLFYGMSRRPGTYDEGIALTGAMRVAAGQIPHRDFYFIYGPAEVYMLAGLFKVFGPSLLVERLFDLLIKALLVASIYAIVSSYCRRSIAIFASVVTIVWLFGAGAFALAITPVSLLNLIGSALLLPIFVSKVSTRRMLAAGAVSGAASLFRYDTGIALLIIHACVISIAVCLRSEGTANKLRTFASTFWPYLLGFALLVTLPALYYFHVAPVGPLFHDIILYPSEYYHRGRNLPFPRLYLRGLENLGIYLPIAIAGMSLYALVAGHWRTGGNSPRAEELHEEQRWHGFLVTFGLLVVVMYLKGMVRVALIQMYLAVIPSILLVAVLYQHQSAFSRPLRIFNSCLLWLTLVAPSWLALHEIRLQQMDHSSLAESIWPFNQDRSRDTQTAWCESRNPLTQGLCFLPEDDRIHTIEFIRAHTQAGQSLYVGLKHHDRVVANDNIIYFATQRLPATHWSHFDPDLQNRYDIQTQMIRELEQNTPPYIVLDAEFDSVREPNDSAKSSGVTLLDGYLHDKYRLIETFGVLSIWQRRSP
jgi:hypothetical protein